MQALDFTNALKAIVKELKVRELVNMMQDWVTLGTPNRNVEEGDKNQFAALLFQSNSGYQQLMEHTSTRKVLEALGIAEVYEPYRLRAMVSAVSTSGNTQQFLGGNYFAVLFSFYDLLRWLVKIEGATEQLLKREKLGDLLATEGVVEFEFLEYADERGVRPERLSVFTSTVDELHRVVSRIYQEESRLTYIYLDSGTKFLFAAKCAKEVAEVMEKLLNLWDKVFFWKYETLSKNLAALSQTLEFNDKVHQQIENGRLTEEEGENLKTRAFRAVEKLTGIGVTAPTGTEMTVERQQRLTELRNMRLLTGETEPALPALTEPGTEN